MSPRPQDEHAEFLERFSAAMDHPPGPVEAARLAAHRASCPPCARVAADFERHAHAMREFPRETMPPDLKAALRSEASAARARAATAATRPPSVARWALAPAAAAVAIALVWLLAPTDPRQRPSSPDERIAELAERAAEPGSGITRPDRITSSPPVPPAGALDVTATAPASPPEPADVAGGRDEASAGAATKVAAESSRGLQYRLDGGGSTASVPPAAPSAPAAAKVVISRFRTSLRVGDPSSTEPLALGPLVAVLEPGSPPQPDRTLVASSAPSARAAEPGPPSAMTARPASAMNEADGRKQQAVTHIVQLLVHVDAGGRIEEAQAVGARTAPEELTHELLRWLVGRTIVPHDEGEPRVIALEITVHDLPAVRP